MAIRNLKEEYASHSEVEAALAEYNKDKPKNEWKYYVSYQNTLNGKWRYVPCDWDFFCSYRNMNRNEAKALDESTRCRVPAERGGLKRCTEDCNQCPYGKCKRDGGVLSLDALTFINKDGSKLQIEIADDRPSIIEKLNEEERKSAMWKEINSLNKDDQLIIKLFSEGLSDSQIAEKVGSKKQTIQYRRAHIISELKIKLKNF